MIAACHATLDQSDGDYALCVHDWSRINHGKHSSKKDRLQTTHARDICYELQSSLLVNAQTGLPLSVVAQNLVSSEGLWQSRSTRLQEVVPAHLDELSERIAWIEEQGLSKRLVHIVDREADSVAHLRQWSAQGTQWLVRVKAGSKVRTAQGDQPASAVALALNTAKGNTQQRTVTWQGQPCTQSVIETQVVLARPARPTRKDKDGQRVKAVAGAPLAA